jgi:selT/selW/selH-like putative selenoprotein
LPQAASLAAAIEKELGLKSALVRGGDGIFDVLVDGERIFSKDESERFPSAREILALLRQR